MGSEKGQTRRAGNVTRPDWYAEFDVGSPSIDGYSTAFRDGNTPVNEGSDSGKELACCFLRMSRLQYGTFDLLTRYETALWRQAAQLALVLQSRLQR